MSQIEFSSLGIGILNLECVVLPPGNKRDVIPLDAIVNTIFLCDRNVEDNVFPHECFACSPIAVQKEHS